MKKGRVRFKEEPKIVRKITQKYSTERYEPFVDARANMVV